MSDVSGADAPEAPADEDAPAAPPSGTPNRSKMLGVLLSEAAGSGDAAKGFVPPFFSCNKISV